MMIVVPSAILATLLVSDGSSTAWSLLFGVLTLVGFIVAGFGAGRLRSDTPMAHGAAAAVVAYAVLQVFGLVRRLAAGDSINWLSYPLTALLAATMGIIGALFAEWYGRRGARAS